MKTRMLCLAVFVILGVSPTLAAYVSVDEFEDGVYSDKWWTGNLTNQTDANGIFSADSTSTDPMLGTHGGVVSLASSTYPVLDLSMANQAGSSTTAQIFWTGTTVGGWSEANSVHFTTKADGRFHTYRLDLTEHPNWLGDITALRIDPTSSSGVHLDIHHVRALEATSYDSIDEFDDGSTSPWSFARIGTVSESGGILSGTATATDPYMIGPTSVAAGTHLELKVRMKVNSGASEEAQIFWAGDWVGGISESNSVKFPIRANGQWYTYTVPLDAHPTWRGPITTVRLDPFQTGTGVSLQLEYFRASEVGQSREIIIDNFDDNNLASFWGLGSIQNAVETTMNGVGYLYGETTSGNPADPYISGSGNANFPAADFPSVRVRMALDPDSEGSVAQIFWVRDGDAGYAGDRYVNFPVIADGQFHTYLVKMADHALWDGMIRSLRLDPISGNTTAGRWFMIDMFAAEVPEPSTFMLLGISLLGLAAFRWRRR